MIRVFAPAKINLTLQVGRPRADGRHSLQSVVVFADVGDWIEAEAADEISLTCVGRFAEALRGQADNIVLRAAAALGARAGVQAGAALKLDKQLPIASGVGGGSSDAAATLKALNQLWACGLGAADLAAIAGALGGDVPVCLERGSAYMTDAGETVTVIDVPMLHAVLVNPLVPLPTAAIYREFDELGLGGAFAPAPAPLWSSAEAAISGAAAIGNDLAAPARKLASVLGDVEAAFRDPRVGYAGLSGSGATMFALTDGAEASAALAGDLALAHPEWWVCSTVLGGPRPC